MYKSEKCARKAENQSYQKSSWEGLEKSQMYSKTSRRLPGPKWGDIWSPSAMLVAVKSQQSATFFMVSLDSSDLSPNVADYCDFTATDIVGGGQISPHFGPGILREPFRDIFDFFRLPQDDFWQL